MDQNNNNHDASWSNAHTNYGIDMGGTYSAHSNDHKNRTYGGMQNKHKPKNNKHHNHNNNSGDRYKGIKLHNCGDSPAIDIILEELYHIRRELRDVKLDIQELKARRKTQPPKITLH